MAKKPATAIIEQDMVQAGVDAATIDANNADSATFDGTPMRQCVGSSRYGIAPHIAPKADFPIQPSSRDGLGRMCKPHWREYTNGLRRDGLARKAGTLAPTVSEPSAKDQAKQARSVAAAAKAAKADPIEVKVPRPARAAKAPKPESEAITRARAVVEATDKLAGAAYLDAIATDEVQDALRALAATSSGPEIHEAMRERQVKYEAAITGEAETPLGETIDSGTEDSDASASDAA